MPSHHLFWPYHTSIDAAFNADCGSALGSMGNRRLDSQGDFFNRGKWFCLFCRRHFLDFDVISQFVLPISYLNQCRIRCRLRQCVWSYVDPETWVKRQFFLSRWVFCIFFASSRFGFRCRLTTCFVLIIHQSMPHSMRIAAVCFDLQGTGDASRKAIFSIEVSDFVCFVAVTF